MKMISTPPHRQMLRADQVDNLGEALLALTREVWTLTDRLTVIEALLEAKGAVTRADIERFQPDAEVQALLAERRERLIRAVVDNLARSPEA